MRSVAVIVAAIQAAPLTNTLDVFRNVFGYSDMAAWIGTIPAVLLAAFCGKQVHDLVTFYKDYFGNKTPSPTPTPLPTPTPIPAPIPTPPPSAPYTPPPVVSGVLGTLFTTLISNEELINPNRVITDGVIQYRPESWNLWNDRRNAEGFQDEFTLIMPVAYRDGGYEVGIGGMCGRVGFGQLIFLDKPACVGIKILGEYNIQDPDYVEHQLGLTYCVTAFVDNEELGLHPLGKRKAGRIEAMWATHLEPGSHVIHVCAFPRYASALLGSWIKINKIGVGIDTTGGHCDTL